LIAIGRSALFKIRAATLSGGILLVLGVGVLVEVGRRLIYGAEPLSEWMIGTALLSLVVNLTVLRLLAPMKAGEVHLRATWLFTRADVVANLARRSVSGFRNRHADWSLCHQRGHRDTVGCEVGSG
jgi:Co/Zn/Cd efflux system component